VSVLFLCKLYLVQVLGLNHLAFQKYEFTSQVVAVRAVVPVQTQTSVRAVVRAAQLLSSLMFVPFQQCPAQ
jgi:hypothetical protein